MAVGGQRHRPHPVPVAGEGLEHLAALQIPDLQGAILRAGDDAFTVGGYRYCIHGFPLAGVVPVKSEALPRRTRGKSVGEGRRRLRAVTGGRAGRTRNEEKQESQETEILRPVGRGGHEGQQAPAARIV